MNEIPTYQPPEGVHGPTLGRDLPDGCERLGASLVPSSDEWWSLPVVSADTLYWWRPVPLKVGDRVQLTGTVTYVSADGGDVAFDGGGEVGFGLPTSALTRVVPAALVTERVPVWEAVDRWMPGGRVICGWQWSTQTRDGSVTHDDGTFTPVHDAPTVEVLKDGGQ